MTKACSHTVSLTDTSLITGTRTFGAAQGKLGQENAKEKLFISTYERGIEACKRYRMRMLPCEEDSEDYVEDNVEGVGE